ncbi:hypothetical protein [Deinococcus hopiensis]|nr:hypothetical protein [Deinococcus hopiensis]
MDSPLSQKSLPNGPRPPRLAFVTVPLLISLFYNALSLLTLPFLGDSVNTLLADMGQATGQAIAPLDAEQITVVLWTSFVLLSGIILLLYFTRRGVLEGRAWGRVASMVIAVLSLLAFPLGTVLGVVMLIGAFDREVQAYTQR